MEIATLEVSKDFLYLMNGGTRGNFRIRLCRRRRAGLFCNLAAADRVDRRVRPDRRQGKAGLDTGRYFHLLVRVDLLPVAGAVE